jgi:hypothetical protein
MTGTRPAAVSRAKSDEPQRIRFEVAAFEEHDGQRDLISETTIDGPPGTDFTINLHDSRFQMNAKFVTDLVAPGTLNIKADLSTRRLYGYSERNLPLYEEDAQNETMHLDFDEKLVLLPFGRNDSNNLLKIEITPAVSEQSTSLPSGEARPLEIKIPKQSPGGAISVEASKIPHHYVIEATLLEDGREVARGAASYHINEPTELLLRPQPQVDSNLINNPLTVDFTILRYSKTGPAGQVDFGFSAYRRDQQGNKGEVVVPQAAGVSDLNSTLNYELGELQNDKRYQLKVTIKLAPDEKAN